MTNTANPEAIQAAKKLEFELSQHYANAVLVLLGANSVNVQINAYLIMLAKTAKVTGQAGQDIAEAWRDACDANAIPWLPGGLHAPDSGLVIPR